MPVLPLRQISIRNTLKSEQAELLAALYHSTVSLDQVIEALNQRPEKGWESVGDFTAKLGSSTATEFDVSKLLSINSQFFHVQATATYGNSTAN